MTLSTKQFEWTLETVITLFVCAVILIGGYFVWTWYNGNKVNGATVVEQASTADATGKIQTSVDNALTDSTADTKAATAAKDGYERKQREILSTDQGAAAWANGVVDVKLRNAARESREARDRLADPEIGGSRTNRTAQPIR